MQYSEFRNRASLVWFAVLMAVLFWLGDSLLDGVFFEATGYYAELIPDDPKELWMRLLLVTAVLGFGIVVQVLVNRRMEDQVRLRLAATAFESAADAIVATDSRNNILDVNPAFEQTTGYAKAEVLGCNPRLLKSGKHDASFYRAMWRQLLDLGHWDGKIWDRRMDGSLYPKWMSLVAVRCDEQISSFVAIFRDISQFKKTEQERLLRNADAAMYRAKDEGRDGWSFYSTDMNRRTRRRLKLSACSGAAAWIRAAWSSKSPKVCWCAATPVCCRTWTSCAHSAYASRSTTSVPAIRH